ncbi:MAG: hypothetical protein II304_07335 [Bacteroidales bacterium]|nr:hypothetical protein [Bacteroidales bacterium]
MNITKIKKKFEKAEKDYIIWKNAICCYEKYAKLPYPENSIDAVFIAYLINDTASEAVKSLNNSGLTTPTGTKFNSNYITNTIDKFESSDSELTIAVRGILAESRNTTKRIWG